MASFNKIILIGRLTKDPDPARTFANGGKVVRFRIAAASSRKKNESTGRWEDVPMFIDVDAFNRGEYGKLADVVEQYCRRGSLICVEGKLVLDEWEKDGQKNSKHRINADTI